VRPRAAAVVTALLFAVASSVVGASPSAAAGGEVVYVVANPAALTAGENAVRARLAGAGYTVTPADDDTVGPAATAGAALVIVGQSSSSNSAAVKSLAPVGVPVWVAKPYLFDDFGLTGRTAGTDYGDRSGGSLTIADPAHPMAAGRTGTVSVQPATGRLSWGRPAAAATVVARAGTDASVFTVAPGAQLATGAAAPACRLTFPLYGNAPASFTADGWALFDAAVAHSTANCAASDPGPDPDPDPAPTGEVLFVVANPAAPNAGERAVRSRLTGSGFTVTLADDTAVTTAQASGAAFVLVSQTVTSNGANIKALARLGVPAWLAKPAYFDDFGLTGSRSGTDFADKPATPLTITAAGHPIAAGRTGTVTLQSGGRLSSGRPAAAATVVARSGTDATIFTLSPGQTQASGSPAPACRLTFPLWANGPTMFTADGWALFDAAARWAASNCGTSTEPDPGPGEVEHVVLVSVDGLNPDAIRQLGPAGAPTFHRLMAEGVSTLDARTVYEATQTLPNHTSMVTSRPVTVTGGHRVTFNEDNGSTVHATAGSYCASVFDVVHDNGGRTALYSGKVKFDFLDRSWNATNGALDTTGADDGRDKIDTYLRDDDRATTNALKTALTTAPADFSMIHYPGPDQTGHAQGYMSAAYVAEVAATDALIGELLDTIAGNAALAASTVVIVTSDHGGLGTSHADATQAVNYTIPFFAWGAGVAHGADVYALNSDRADPGTTRPTYAAAIPPVRNAEAGNLALDLLGLPAIPGSRINPDQSLDVA
jgi:hypothetical protein